MSKLGNVAAGLLGGYVGYKQEQERREDRKLDREMYQSLLGKKKDAAAPVAAPAATNAMAEGAQAADEIMAEDEGVRGFANGGMVGEMPKHYDRFMWQKQSFKKGTPSF
jgi:hypothetical protein